MTRIAGGVFILALALPTLGDDANTGKQPKTSAEQVQALIDEYETAYRAYAKARNQAKTFDERDRIRKEMYPDVDQFAPRFFALAEKYANDPAAVDALVWVMSNLKTSAKDQVRSKTIDLLLRHHVESDKLGNVCRSLNKGVDQQGETFLRAVLDKNSHAEVQGDACRALAQRLRFMAGIVREVNQGAEAAAQHAESFGKDRVAELVKRDAAQLEAESEQLFRRFAEKHLSQLKEERLTGLCLQFGLLASDRGSEVVLRTMLDKNSNRDVRGLACLSLAQLLKNRLNELPSADGKDAAVLCERCEQLLRRVASEYGDVDVFRTTLGERAKAERYEFQHLLKGMTAPDIEAEDLDGRPFKLSDYRGKVVLLDFWGHW